MTKLPRTHKNNLRQDKYKPSGYQTASGIKCVYSFSNDKQRRGCSLPPLKDLRVLLDLILRSFTIMHRSMAHHSRNSSKQQISLPLFFLLLSLLCATTFACVCPRRPFSELFAIFPTVVKAETLSVVKIADIPPTYRFELRVLNVFKGCRPSKSIFYGESRLVGVVCQVFLREGWVIRLALREPGGMLNGTQVYTLRDCEEQLLWKATPLKEKRFLRLQRSLPESRCKV